MEEYLPDITILYYIIYIYKYCNINITNCYLHIIPYYI